MKLFKVVYFLFQILVEELSDNLIKGTIQDPDGKGAGTWESKKEGDKMTSVSQPSAFPANCVTSPQKFWSAILTALSSVSVKKVLAGMKYCCFTPLRGVNPFDLAVNYLPRTSQQIEQKLFEFHSSVYTGQVLHICWNSWLILSMWAHWTVNASFWLQQLTDSL